MIYCTTWNISVCCLVTPLAEIFLRAEHVAYPSWIPGAGMVLLYSRVDACLLNRLSQNGCSDLCLTTAAQFRLSSSHRSPSLTGELSVTGLTVYVPPSLYFEGPTPRVTVVRDRAFLEAMKGK